MDCHNFGHPNIDTSQKDADVYQQQNVVLFFSTSYTVHSVHGSFEYLFLALHLMLIENYEKDRQTYRFNSGGRDKAPVVPFNGITTQCS